MKLRRVSDRGFASERAGSRAGCKPGSYTCVSLAGCWRDLGPAGFFTFQLLVRRQRALAALVHPLFMGALIYSVVSGAPIWRGDSATAAILGAVYGTTVIVGYLASAFLGWLGLLRRGLWSMAGVLLLTPLHWLLLSLAAWRALYQLVLDINWCWRPSPGRRPSTAWRRIRAGPPI